MSRWLDLARAYEGGMPLQEILKTLPDNLTKPDKSPHTGENTRNSNMLPKRPFCQVTPDTTRQKVMEKGEDDCFQGDSRKLHCLTKGATICQETALFAASYPFVRFCQVLSGSALNVVSL